MNRKTGRIVAIILCLSLAAGSYFCLAGKKRIKADSGVQTVMGTFVRIIVVAKNADTGTRCVEAGLAEIRKVDELMSDYKDDSEISLVNKKAAQQAVRVSESTFEVLQKSMAFSQLTDGAFDITIGPLVDIFHKTQKKHVAPTQEQIEQAKTKVGFEKLILDTENQTVRLADDGMRLDLGGIAKGYGVDKAVEAARRRGAVGVMVNIGGDVRCFGEPPEGRDHWLIGLQDPNSGGEGFNGGGLVLTLRVKNAAVATSGDYEQFVIIDGKRYSHIMNRKTGTSVEGLSSVTIISENATDADALATSVSVMGPEKGLALIETLPGIEAILMTPPPNSQILKTSGADKYIR
ncbi:MAG: FAD:protein FMN transferase [Sedimentisphaerales bacterium]|nr:FAD:protein FMN transferase [Sedimentisphaerales bacterium]